MTKLKSKVKPGSRDTNGIKPGVNLVLVYLVLVDFAHQNVLNYCPLVLCKVKHISLIVKQDFYKLN